MLGKILLVLVVIAVGATGASAEAEWELFVSTEGSDNNPGTRVKPFKSLERARQRIRALKRDGLLTSGATVWLRAGTYPRDRTFRLTEEDSGTETAPIVYRAYPGEEVRLTGGREVSSFTPITDPAVLSRLDEAARGNVLQADLKALGITDFGEMIATGNWLELLFSGADSGEVTTASNRLELFFQDKPMTLARWPNEGFVNIVDVVGGEPINVRGTKGDKIGKFVYEGDRPQRWGKETDVWLHGYWFWDWADQRQKVESIDTENRIISLVQPYHSYGYRKGQWYYAFDVLAELDMPGEWYLDRETGVLYFWPPAPLEEGTAVVSVLPTLLTMNNCSHLTVRGLMLEAARGAAVTIRGGEGNLVAGCTIRNCGRWAVEVSGGQVHGVVGYDIYYMGDGGIILRGGDRRTLTPAGHYAENNHIHHYSRGTTFTARASRCGELATVLRTI